MKYETEVTHYEHPPISDAAFDSYGNFLDWHSAVGSRYIPDLTTAWQCWQTFVAHQWKPYKQGGNDAAQEREVEKGSE